MQDVHPLEVDYDDEPIIVSCTITEQSANDALKNVKAEELDVDQDT